VTGAASVAANIRKAVSRAGYRVQALVLDPLATARAVLSEDEKEVGVAMVEVGAAGTQLVVYYEGKLRHIGQIGIGGDAVTNDLVRGLSVPFAEAQKAKEQYAVAFTQLVDPQETVELPGPSPGQRRHVARELIAHIVEQRLDELFGMVQDELERIELLDRLGAGIVLTGGTAALHGIVEMAAQVFATPVRIGIPDEGLSGLADSVGRPRFATVTGLCLFGADRFHETGEGVSTLSSGVVTRVGAWIREFF
jgi:cell division protein FtsA